MNKHNLKKPKKKIQGKAVYTILTILTVLIHTSLNSQSVMRAASEQISHMGPMKGSLVSSSDLKDYRFYNPFLVRNVNPAGDQFGYDQSNNTLSFQIDRMGYTHSMEKRLYIVFYNTDVDFVKATRTTTGYDETYIVKNYASMSPPDHSLMSTFPSFSKGLQKQCRAYDLGVSDWAGLTGIEIKFNKPINEDFLLTIMVTNPNRYIKPVEELLHFFAGPARFLGRILGESQYSNYVSFANFHFEYDAPQDAFCSSLRLTSSVYPETNNLASIVQRDLGRDYSVADWNDIKAIRNIERWISCMGLKSDEDYMVTLNGNSKTRNGDRQYFIRFAPEGITSNFWVHEEIDNKLFLGSWYNLNLKILAKNIVPQEESIEHKSQEGQAYHAGRSYCGIYGKWDYANNYCIGEYGHDNHIVLAEASPSTTCAGYYKTYGYYKGNALVALFISNGHCRAREQTFPNWPSEDLTKHCILHGGTGNFKWSYHSGHKWQGNTIGVQCEVNINNRLTSDPYLKINNLDNFDDYFEYYGTNFNFQDCNDFILAMEQWVEIFLRTTQKALDGNNVAIVELEKYVFENSKFVPIINEAGRNYEIICPVEAEEFKKKFGEIMNQRIDELDYQFGS